MPPTHIPMRLGHISYLPVIGILTAPSWRHSPTLFFDGIRSRLLVINFPPWCKRFRWRTAHLWTTENPPVLSDRVGEYHEVCNNNIITNFDSVLVALFNALANGSGHRFVPDSYIRTLYTGHIYKASKIKQDLLLVVSNSSSLQMASWKWRGMTQCFLLSRAALPASSRISAQGIRGWRRGDGGSGGRHVLTRRCKWGWWPWLRCGSCPAKCKKRKPLSRLHAKGLLCVIICCQKDR